MRLGIDAGAENLKVAWVDDKWNVVDSCVERSEGDSIEKLEGLLDRSEVTHVGVSGVEGEVIAQVLGVGHVENAVALESGFGVLHPDARTVFDIGMENSSFYLLNGNSGGLDIEDFSTNSSCGAGGGALIEKMAKRLRFEGLEDFVEAAVNAESVANIAGRCGVFAESDVVHHYQRGAGADSIAAGLCRMLANNFLINVLQGREIRDPVYFIGGVSRNKAVVKSLEELIGKRLIVPEDEAIIKALGAACNGSDVSMRDVKERIRDFKRTKEKPASRSRPLGLDRVVIEARDYQVIDESTHNKVLLSLDEGYRFPVALDGFLGLDVGSVSTKAVLVDGSGRFVLGIYERTVGRPIDAVKSVMGRIGDLEVGGRKVKDSVTVRGAGVTGSGRYMAGQIIGADVVKNEITAQARGAAFFCPDVDTVFEIGGQDSKFIRSKNGRVVGFEMNKVCAASTGSFLEEQAGVLGIDIERQFADHALGSERPCDLAEKCAVLMASSLLSFQDSPIGDRCAGLAYSVCHNYLNRVVGNKRIGKRISFQGAVAFNNAIVAGFATILNGNETQIYVPPYPHLTGAIGMAEIVRERYLNDVKV